MIFPERLSRRAATILLDTSSAVFVSAATAWELATKVRIGKLPQALSLADNFVEIISEAGYTLLSITPEDALRAGRLPGTHRDPFDRMLAAQSLALDVSILSKDPQLDSFGIHRIW